MAILQRDCRHTLEYLIIVRVQWLAKKDNLMLLNQYKASSINLNAQYVNEMTLGDFPIPH